MNDIIKLIESYKNKGYIFNGDIEIKAISSKHEVEIKIILKDERNINKIKNNKILLQEGDY